MPCDEGYCGNYHSHDDEELISVCPACGSPIDYCQGHGEIGDKAGWVLLQLHDNGDHTHCHPNSDCGE